MHQRGLVTLWASTVLLILTGLWGWLCLQAVNAEKLRSHQQMHAAQALANSEALLETTLAHLEQAYGKDALEADARIWWSSAAIDCPAGKAPPQWQCTQWPLTQVTLPEWTHQSASQVRLVRDVRNSPHRIQVMVDAKLNDRHPGAGSRSTVQQSLYVPLSSPQATNALTNSLDALSPALVLNEQEMRTDPPLCNPSSWQTVFGELTPPQVKALSALQVRNGLTANSQVMRTIYWIDSPHLWTQSIGTTASPVVLVFSSEACALLCPSLASSSQVVGTVFYQNQCQASKMWNWQSGIIAGQLGVESNLPPELKLALHSGQLGLTATANAHAAFNFVWPPGAQASRVQRVAGTWKNAGY
jgi:hypothetical protein